jgi:hypothetical protein
MKTTPMKTAVAAAYCLLALGGTANAQSTFNNGVNGTGNPGNSGADTNASVTGQTNATDNTSGTPAPNDVPPVSAIGGNTTPVGAVPEPETYAMMATGLGLIAYIGRRRKKSKKDKR